MQDEISLRDIYFILRKHVRWIIILPVVFAVLGAIYALFLMTPIYKAESTFTVQSTQLKASFESKIQTTDVQGFSNSQIESVANSHPVFEAVLKAVQSQPDVPAAWLREDFDADRLGKNTKVKFAKPQIGITPDQILVPIITLSVEAPTAHLAAFMSNEWMKQTLTALNRLPKVRMESSIDTVASELEKSTKERAQTQTEYLDFTTRSTLALDQGELNNAITERTGLINLIVQAQQSLKQAQVQKEAQTQNYLKAENVIAQVSGAEAASLAGGDLEQVRGHLTTQTKDAKAKYDVTRTRVADFLSKYNMPVLSAQETALSARIGAILNRLQTITTDLTVSNSKLAEVRAQLSGQPKLLILEREITSDPTLNAAAAQSGGKLAEVLGLKLKNQEINPLYQGLLQNSITLQADIKNMITERTAITAEKVSLEPKLAGLRGENSRLNKQLTDLQLEATIASGIYVALKSRLEQFASVRSPNERALTLDNPNPEYQRLRSSLNDLSVSVALQQSTLTNYKAREKALDARILELRGRVAKSVVQTQRLSEDFAIAQESFKALKQKLADLKLEQASAGNLAQVLVEAYPPYKKSNPGSLPVLIAAVLGLLIGLLIPFLIEAVKEPTPVQAVGLGLNTQANPAD
jgi:uncharacterized protein involved in exopolysaccharide biosynthesis